MEPELTAWRVWRRSSTVDTEQLVEKEANFEGTVKRRNASQKSGGRLQPASRPRSDGAPSFMVGGGRRVAWESAARGRSRRAEKNHQQL